MSSNIVTGDLDMRWVWTPTTDWLSSCTSNLLSFSLGGLDRAAHDLRLLEGNVSAFVLSALEPPRLDAVVEHCSLAETDGVEVEVGGLHGLEDGSPVVLFKHRSPPLEISLELLRDSHGPRP